MSSLFCLNRFFFKYFLLDLFKSEGSSTFDMIQREKKYTKWGKVYKNHE